MKLLSFAGGLTLGERSARGPCAARAPSASRWSFDFESMFACVTDKACAFASASWASFGAADFLALRIQRPLGGTAQLELLLGAPPVALAPESAFPSGFSGGEQLTITLTSPDLPGPEAVTAVFDAADQTAAACALRINSIAALSDSRIRAAVTDLGLEITAKDTPGAAARLELAGPAAAALDLPSAASGRGAPLAITSLALMGLALAPGDAVWIRNPGGQAVHASLILASGAP